MTDINQAARLFAWEYAGHKGVRCTECGEEVWGTKSGASEEYEALGEHLVQAHPEMHEKLIEQWRMAK